MKNSKGISMITLIITIIIMLILAGIVYVVSDDGRERADKAKYLNEIKLIREAAQSRFAGYLRSSTTYPLEGTLAKDSLAEILLQLETLGCESTSLDEMGNEINVFLSDNVENSEYSRIINYADMLELGITNVSSKTTYVYLVNYYSLDVVGPIK